MRSSYSRVGMTTPSVTNQGHLALPAPRGGLEPPTCGLTVRRSTIELSGNVFCADSTRGDDWSQSDFPLLRPHACGHVNAIMTRISDPNLLLESLMFTRLILGRLEVGYHDITQVEEPLCARY